MTDTSASTKRKWLWIGGAAVIGAMLVLPALGIGAGQALTLLLVLLCPLMHFLGMHRHGHGGAAGEREPLPPRGSGRERPGPPQTPERSER